MKSKMNLKQWLLSHNVDSSTPADVVDALKEAYKKLYHKSYQVERIKREKRVELRLNLLEYSFFMEQHKKYEIRFLGRFIKDCAIAYLRQTFLPLTPSSMKSLEQEIQICGNNINQLIHASHALRDYSNKERYAAIKHEVDTIKKMVMNHLNNPKLLDGKTLAEYLRAYLTINPEHKQKIIEFIEEQ